MGGKVEQRWREQRWRQQQQQQMEEGAGGAEDAPRRLLEAANDEAREPRLSSVLFFFSSVHALGRFAAACVRLCSHPQQQRGAHEDKRKEEKRVTSCKVKTGHLIAEADKNPGRPSHHSLPALLKQSLCRSH